MRMNGRPVAKKTYNRLSSTLVYKEGRIEQCSEYTVLNPSGQRYMSPVAA